jgi:hypothetical protein
MNATDFHFYRYFLICQAQKSLFEIEEEDIKEKFKQIFIKNKKIKYPYNSKEYILYSVSDINKDLFICKLSISKKVTIHREGERDINNDRETDHPYVHIVINTHKQIILIQKNTSVFKDTNVVKNRITEIINKIIQEFNYLIKIEAIVDKDHFWSTVSSAKQIYSLNLKLNAPNLFGARVKANEFMKEQKKTYNLNVLEFKFSNESGDLYLSKDALDDFIEYASEGGGSYRLLYNDGKTNKIATSTNANKKILLPQELTPEDYETILSEMNRIDTLRDQNE